MSRSDQRLTRLDSSVVNARVGNEYFFFDGGAHASSTEISDPKSPQYAPRPRFDHCSSLINKKLYVHHGQGCFFTEPVVDEYDILSEEWSCRTTTGDVLEAKSGIASAHKGNKFYTFGGEIKARQYTNILSELDISSMLWRTLRPLNPQKAPIPKKDAAMISYQDYLVIFGGLGVSAGGHKGSKYERGGADEVWTNEVTLYDINRSQWMWKKISGTPPEPCSECTLTFIGQNQAILLGGIGKDGKIGKGFITAVKLLDFSNWNWLTLTCKAWQDKLLPTFCSGHCTVSLHEVLDCSVAPSVLLLWGRTDEAKYQSDMWQLTVNPDGGIWRKVSVLHGTSTSCPPTYKCTTDIVRTPDDLQLVRFGGIIVDKKSPFDDTWIVDLACTSDKEVAVINCRIPRPISNPPSIVTSPLHSNTTDVAAVPENGNDHNMTPAEISEGPCCTSSSNFVATDNSSATSIVADDTQGGTTSASTDEGSIPISCSDGESLDPNLDNTKGTHISGSSTNGKDINAIQDCTLNPKVNNGKILNDTENSSESKSSVFTKHQEYPGLNFFNQSVVEELKHSSATQEINMKSMGLSFVIPPEAIPSDQQVVNLTVVPAIGGNIEAPPDCQSYSPLYMIAPCKLAKEAKINVDHTCSIENEEDVRNMVVLVPVDLSESQSTGTYMLKETDFERSFKTGSQTGEIKMKNLQPFRVAKKESLKSEGKQRIKKLYTARLFKKSLGPCTPGDTLVFCVSQLHPSYLQCLQDHMSRKYPELSHEERFDALQFREDYNEVSLSIPDSNDINGWDIFTMKQEITRDEVDLPNEVDIFGLDYPPMIILKVRNDRPHPSQNGKRCSLEVIGFTRKDFKISIVFEIIGVQNRWLKSLSYTPLDDDVTLLPISLQLYREETVLQTSDLRVLCVSLKEVSPYWKDIGLELCLPLYSLENIEGEPVLIVRGNEAFFPKMLSTWLRSTSEKEAKTVGRLKEALVHASCHNIAYNLLDELNSDFRRKFNLAISDLRSCMKTWVENDMIKVGYSIASLLDDLLKKIWDFSTFLDTAEDIHRNCLVLINHEAVQSIQGSNASDLQGAAKRVMEDSHSFKDVISRISNETENMSSVLQSLQNLTNSIHNLFKRTEAASLCDNKLPFKWRRKLKSSTSFPIHQGLDQ